MIEMHLRVRCTVWQPMHFMPHLSHVNAPTHTGQTRDANKMLLGFGRIVKKEPCLQVKETMEVEIQIQITEKPSSKWIYEQACKRNLNHLYHPCCHHTLLNLHDSNKIHKSLNLHVYLHTTSFCVILWRPPAALGRSTGRGTAEVTAEGKMAAPRKATVVLKAVKKIAIQFSPFQPNVRSTR